jgi:hypothetical protein
LQNLKFMSSVSLVCVTYTLLTLTMNAVEKIDANGFPPLVAGEPSPGHIGADGERHPAEVSTLRYSVDIISAIPIFVFSYMLHPSYCLVFDEMQDRRLESMGRAVSWTLLGCTFVYSLFGIFGLFYCALDLPGVTPPFNPPGDILVAFPHDYNDINVARFGMSISVISSYVGLHFGARTCIRDLCLGGEDFSRGQFAAEAVLYVFLTAGVAILVPEVEVVINLFTGTAGVALIFLFPGAMVVSLAGGGGEGPGAPHQSGRHRSLSSSADAEDPESTMKLQPEGDADKRGAARGLFPASVGACCCTPC